MEEELLILEAGEPKEPKVPDREGFNKWRNEMMERLKKARSKEDQRKITEELEKKWKSKAKEYNLKEEDLDGIEKSIKSDIKNHFNNPQYTNAKEKSKDIGITEEQEIKEKFNSIKGKLVGAKNSEDYQAALKELEDYKDSYKDYDLGDFQEKLDNLYNDVSKEKIPKEGTPEFEKWKKENENDPRLKTKAQLKKEGQTALDEKEREKKVQEWEAKKANFEKQLQNASSQEEQDEILKNYKASLSEYNKLGIIPKKDKEGNIIGDDPGELYDKAVEAHKQVRTNNPNLPKWKDPIKNKEEESKRLATHNSKMEQHQKKLENFKKLLEDPANMNSEDYERITKEYNDYIKSEEVVELNNFNNKLQSETPPRGTPVDPETIPDPNNYTQDKIDKVLKDPNLPKSKSDAAIKDLEQRIAKGEFKSKDEIEKAYDDLASRKDIKIDDTALCNSRQNIRTGETYKQLRQTKPLSGQEKDQLQREAKTKIDNYNTSLKNLQTQLEKATNQEDANKIVENIRNLKQKYKIDDLEKQLKDENIEGLTIENDGLEDTEKDGEKVEGWTSKIAKMPKDKRQGDWEKKKKELQEVMNDPGKSQEEIEAKISEIAQYGSKNGFSAEEVNSWIGEQRQKPEYKGLDGNTRPEKKVLNEAEIKAKNETTKANLAKYNQALDKIKKELENPTSKEAYEKALTTYQSLQKQYKEDIEYGKTLEGEDKTEIISCEPKFGKIEDIDPELPETKTEYEAIKKRKETKELAERFKEDLEKQIAGCKTQEEIDKILKDNEKQFRNYLGVEGFPNFDTFEKGIKENDDLYKKKDPYSPETKEKKKLQAEELAKDYNTKLEALNTKLSKAESKEEANEILEKIQKHKGDKKYEGLGETLEKLGSTNKLSLPLDEQKDENDNLVWSKDKLEYETKEEATKKKAEKKARESYEDALKNFQEGNYESQEEYKKAYNKFRAEYDKQKGILGLKGDDLNNITQEVKTNCGYDKLPERWESDDDRDARLKKEAKPIQAFSDKKKKFIEKLNKATSQEDFDNIKTEYQKFLEDNQELIKKNDELDDKYKVNIEADFDFEDEEQKNKYNGLPKTAKEGRQLVAKQKAQQKWDDYLEDVRYKLKNCESQEDVDSVLKGFSKQAREAKLAGLIEGSTEDIFSDLQKEFKYDELPEQSFSNEKPKEEKPKEEKPKKPFMEQVGELLKSGKIGGALMCTLSYGLSMIFGDTKKGGEDTIKNMLALSDNITKTLMKKEDLSKKDVGKLTYINNFNELLKQNMFDVDGNLLSPEEIRSRMSDELNYDLDEMIIDDLPEEFTKNLDALCDDEDNKELLKTMAKKYANDIKIKQEEQKDPQDKELIQKLKGENDELDEKITKSMSPESVTNNNEEIESQEEFEDEDGIVWIKEIGKRGGIYVYNKDNPKTKYSGQEAQRILKNKKNKVQKGQDQTQAATSN